MVDSLALTLSLVVVAAIAQLCGFVVLSAKLRIISNRVERLEQDQVKKERELTRVAVRFYQLRDKLAQAGLISADGSPEGGNQSPARPPHG